MPNPPQQIAVVVTPNLHLATLLGTCGCKPRQIVRGPGKTTAGTDIVRWVYDSTPEADRLVAMWAKPEFNAPDFKDLSRREQEIVVEYVAAFAANLKHFLAHTKEAK